jgi:hypothetical protein
LELLLVSRFLRMTLDYCFKALQNHIRICRLTVRSRYRVLLEANCALNLLKHCSEHGKNVYVHYLQLYHVGKNKTTYSIE